METSSELCSHFFIGLQKICNPEVSIDLGVMEYFEESSILVDPCVNYCSFTVCSQICLLAI